MVMVGGPITTMHPKGFRLLECKQQVSKPLITPRQGNTHTSSTNDGGYAVQQRCGPRRGTRRTSGTSAIAAPSRVAAVACGAAVDDDSRRTTTTADTPSMAAYERLAGSWRCYQPTHGTASTLPHAARDSHALHHQQSSTSERVLPDSTDSWAVGGSMGWWRRVGHRVRRSLVMP